MSDLTVELRPLLGGEILLTHRFEAAPPGPLPKPRTVLAQVLRVRTHWAPVPAFLLRHPTEGDVLVDTAYDPSAATDPVRTLGAVTGRMFEHRPRPLRPQLAELGAAPGHVVMTHLHSDHASGLGEFPDATVVCDRVEWDASRAPGAWSYGYVKAVLSGVERTRLVDVDAGEPYGPFARTHDLFGDGTIRLVSTRGHSPGHCSVLVRTASGEVLLCGDACGAERGLYDLVPMAIFVDREATLASMRAIQQWFRAEPGRLAVPGHDHGWTTWLGSGAVLEARAGSGSAFASGT